MSGIMSGDMNEELLAMRRKLRYRAWHMGTKELDLLCGRYVDAMIENFDKQALKDFSAMLKITDKDLQDILMAPDFPDPLPEMAQPHLMMLKHVYLWHHGG